MTIWFPDVSKYNAGVKIQPGTVVVVARCTLSDSYFDPSYEDFKAQAAAVGAFFVGYHWLNHGNIESQAKWWLSHAGDTPCMIDVEDLNGNTGYNGPCTVDDVTAFADYVNTHGGHAHLAYIPKWYWAGDMGSPDLTPIVQHGEHLVASNYSTYSDSGIGWSAYGHVTPDEWQYTDALPYGGGAVDFNAYKGTVQSYIAMAQGLIVAPVPVPPKALGDDMTNHWQTQYPGATGDTVRILQGLLLAHGYPVGRVGIDGDYGPITTASVKRLQEDKKISVDGIFGPHTLSVALYNVDYQPA